MPISQLSPEQRMLRDLALSPTEKGDAPFLTNDPRVNHAVDQHMEDSTFTYNEAMYTQEIEAWKETGGLLLAWEK